MRRNAQGQMAVLHSSATQWKHMFRLEIGLEKGYLSISGLLSKTGSYGRETLVVVAETKADDGDAVRREIHDRIKEVVGVPPKDIVLVAPGTLPKTSSGKLQRSLCRRRYDDGQLALVHA